LNYLQTLILAVSFLALKDQAPVTSCPCHCSVSVPFTFIQGLIRSKIVAWTPWRNQKNKVLSHVSNWMGHHQNCWTHTL